MYKKRFIKGSQASLKDARKQLREISRFIYSNLTTDVNFLNAMKTGDTTSVKNLIKAAGDSAVTSGCTQKKACDTSVVQKMVFTMSLYSYYKSRISTTDPAYDDMVKMFDKTADRTIDPASFFYYNHPIYIPNLYASLTADIPNAWKIKTVAGLEQSLTNSIRVMFRNLNLRLSKLYKVSDGKRSVRNYMFVFFMYSLLFACAVVGIFWPEVGPSVTVVFRIIREYFRKKEPM